MSGKPGRSGAPGVTRKAGPGALPKRFTLEDKGQYSLSTTTANGEFLSLQLTRVVKIDRKAITLETQDGNRITIYCSPSTR